jgi:hypothetical protein
MNVAGAVCFDLVPTAASRGRCFGTSDYHALPRDAWSASQDPRAGRGRTYVATLSEIGPVAWYNFRSVHQTLRVAPAREAGGLPTFGVLKNCSPRDVWTCSRRHSAVK